MPADIARGALVRAVIMILISGLGIGLLPNMTKLALQSGGDAPTVLFGRTLLALLTLGIYIKITRGTLRVRREALWIALATGVAMAVQSYTAVYAINHIEISLFMLILFTHPFLVAMFYHFAGSTRLTGWRMLWSVSAFAGVGLAISVDFSVLTTTGLVLSAASALACAVLVVGMVSLGSHAGLLTATFQLSIYPLVLAAVAIGVQQEVHLPATALGWIGIAGAGLAFVVSFVTFLEAARILGGSRASVMSFVEPIFAIIIAAIMFGEHLTALQWAGATLVALSLFMLEAPAAFAAKPSQAATTSA